MGHELNKGCQDISFAFQQIEPFEFTKIIDKAYIVFVSPSDLQQDLHTSEWTSSKGEKETLLKA